MYVVVGAVLSRYCSALERKFVYDYFILGGLTPKHEQWKVALLWMSAETFLGLLAGLWYRLWLQCGTKAHVSSLELRAGCASLSSVLAFCVLLGRLPHLSGLTFLHY